MKNTPRPKLSKQQMVAFRWKFFLVKEQLREMAIKLGELDTELLAMEAHLEETPTIKIRVVKSPHA